MTEISHTVGSTPHLYVLFSSFKILPATFFIHEQSKTCVQYLGLLASSDSDAFHSINLYGGFAQTMIS